MTTFLLGQGCLRRKGQSIKMANLRTLPQCVLAGALLSLGVSSAQTSQIAVMPSNRIVSPVDNAQLTTLRGTVSPLATQRNDLGAAPDGLQLNSMHVVLKRSDAQEAALRQLINDMHTPGSPNYHKWLTPDQFGAQFGPSDQDVAAVTTWLTNQGFNVSKVNPGRQTIEVSGSVAQLRNAFHTQIHQYSFNGQTRYANANDPQIPAALTPVVAGFVSLNNFPIRSYAHLLGKAQYEPATGKATPQWTVGSSAAGFNFVLSPADYAVQYDLNSLYNAGIDGTGQTIAIINESNINVAVVNQFRTLFGLPANPPQVIIDGNDPGIDGINNPGGPNFAAVEAYLDVEWAGAVAPKANIDLVIAGDTALQNGLILAAERAVYSNIAPIISVSFGNCEKVLGSANPFISSLWEQAAAQGITVAVSTGDAGAAGCDNDNAQSYATGGQAVNGFASTPFNVAVGGTDFYYSQYAAGSTALSNQIAGYWGTTASNSTPAVSIKGVIPEQPWNASQYGLNINSYYSSFQDTTIAGAGGGASNAAVCASPGYNSSGQCTTGLSGYPKPAWQTGVSGIPTDGVRDIPDVSLFASSGINASYYPLCASDGDCQTVTSGSVQISGVGGTSASTPAFAGIMALVNQKVAARQGNANTILYPLAKQFPNSFHDVTVGNISVPCQFLPTASPNCIAVTSPISLGSGTSRITEGQIGTGTTPLYNATAGYDLASGLGTIDAANLVNNWNKVVLNATTTSMTVTPANSAPLTNIPHGTSVTFAGTVTGTGTPTGDVALITDNTEQSQQGATKFTLSSGAYSGTTANLPGGTYNVWTQYSGDATNAMSTSPKQQITVAPETSAIDFNIFAGSSYYTPSKLPTAQVDYGTQFLLSALVAPSTQAANLQNCLVNGGTICSSVIFTAPTGTVTFADNSSTLNIAAINSEGDAEYNAPFTVGAHSVTAAYAGDKSYNASTSGPITFTVVKDTPALQLSASALSTVNNQTSGIVGSNQPLVLTVQVINGAQNSAATSNTLFPVPVAPPTGTVTVSGLPSGVQTSATLIPGVDPASQGGIQAVEGVANFTVPAGTAAGTYNVTFNYSGDSNYNSKSAPFTIPIVTTTGKGLAATITGSISGTSTTPTATLTISGTVTGSTTNAFNEPITPLWPATGGAVLAVLFFLVPRRRRNWLVVSSMLTILISGIAIGCGGGSSNNGGGGGGGGGGGTATAPTGTVYVYASGYYIAQFNLVKPSSGAASTYTGTVNSASIPQGVNQLTLQYSGDSTYAPAAFTLSSNVSNLLSDFSLIPASSNVQLTAGGSGTTAINLGSINGFTGPVTLSCTADPGVTCSLSALTPSTLASGGTASAVLTINATSGVVGKNYNIRVTGTDSSGKYVHTLAITAMVR